MSSPLNDLDTGQLIVLTNALAVSFSKGLTSNEIEVLGGLLTTVGDLMALIAANMDIT